MRKHLSRRMLVVRWVFFIRLYCFSPINAHYRPKTSECLCNARDYIQIVNIFVCVCSFCYFRFHSLPTHTTAQYWARAHTNTRETFSANNRICINMQMQIETFPQCECLFASSSLFFDTVFAFVFDVNLVKGSKADMRFTFFLFIVIVMMVLSL